MWISALFLFPTYLSSFISATHRSLLALGTHFRHFIALAYPLPFPLPFPFTKSKRKYHTPTYVITSATFNGSSEECSSSVRARYRTSITEPNTPYSNANQAEGHHAWAEAV